MNTVVQNKKVVAYYCGRCFPAHPNETDPNRAEVKIEYADDSWETVLRIPLGSGELFSKKSERQMAKKVLEHFLGMNVPESKVDQLLDMPGQSIMRLTPDDLRPFLQMSLFD